MATFRGAFAEVKKALYIADDSPFAIKIIDKYHTPNSQEED